MKRLILITLLAVIAVSCKTSCRIKIRELPPVYLSDQVKAIGVVNRSFTNPGTNAGNILDKVDQALSLEGANLDSSGSVAAIEGAINRLERYERFEKVSQLPDVKTNKPVPDQMDIPMTWDEVEKICIDNDVQILFVMESFDTDTDVKYSTQRKTVNGPLGTQVPLIEHIATLTVRIKQGWRIYDPATKTILDAHYEGNSKTNTSRGINPIKAAEGLLTRDAVVKELAWDIGNRYPRKIEWNTFWVSREYYNKGSQKLKIAKRYCRVRDWHSAAELWLEEIENSPKRKVKGRACFNMALHCEWQGKLDEAMEWAQKAHVEYRIGAAADYYYLLRRRKAREDEKQRILNQDRQ